MFKTNEKLMFGQKWGKMQHGVQGVQRKSTCSGCTRAATAHRNASPVSRRLHSAILFKPLLLTAQGEVHRGVVVVVACIFASPSAVPWCARDGLRLTCPPCGSRLCAGHDQSRRSGHMRSKLGVVRRRMGQQDVRPGVPSTRAPDPNVAQEAANQQVSKLEAALRAMGDYDGPEVATLKSSLQKARAASRSKPIQDQIAEIEAFISRAQKRLSVLEEERERLRRELQIEREELPCAVPDVSAHCCRTQEGDDLRPEVDGRSGVWMANKPPDVDQVPPIPVQEQHMHDWLSSRNCELGNALEFGDHSTISKLSSLLAEGCGRLAAFGTVHGHQFKIRFDDCFVHGWRRKAPLPSWEGCSSVQIGNQVS